MLGTLAGRGGHIFEHGFGFLVDAFPGGQDVGPSAAEGYVGVVADDALPARAVAADFFHEDGEDGFGDASGLTPFIHNKDALGLAGGLGDGLFREGEQPAQVHDADLVAILFQVGGGLPRQVMTVAVGDDEKVAVFGAVEGGGEALEGAGGGGVFFEPEAVAVFEQVLCHIEGDGFEEGDHGAVFFGHSYGGTEHVNGVGGGGGGGDDQAGDVPQAGDAVVVVKVASEAFLVGEGCDANDHGVGELAFGEEFEGAGFTADLVDGVVEVGQVLNLGDGEQSALGRADGQAEDGLFVEEGVEDPGEPEALVKVGGDGVDAAFDSHVFAKHEDALVVSHEVVEGGVEELGEVPGAVSFGELVIPKSLAGLGIGFGVGLTWGGNGERGHDALGAFMAGSRFGFLTGGAGGGEDGFVLSEDLAGAHEAEFHGLASGVEDRVLGFAVFDLLHAPVTVFRVGASVAHEADHFEVKKDRAASEPAFIDGRFDSVA